MIKKKFGVKMKVFRSFIKSEVYLYLIINYIIL